MKWTLETAALSPSARDFEIVERKGTGHPDTLCDALAERFSVALSRFYVDRFGLILHHNVDKVLLVGGAAAPRFGGGEITEPIEIFFAGRATRRYKGVDVPVEALAIEVTRALLGELFRAIDPVRYVKVHCLVRPGSEDLVELFERQQRGGIWLANDSSIGAGFAPLSPLEDTVLAIDRALAAPEMRQRQPSLGEDVKLLAARRTDQQEMTVACAFCDRFVSDIDDYFRQKADLAAQVSALCAADTAVTVNAADDRAARSIYLTVSGTSAEAGDDGEAGRGNRANGLITPCRPMTMEGVAGKNPVSHVGKLYNLAARDIATAVVDAVPEVAAAECYLASRIGEPVTAPAFLHLRIAPHHVTAVDELRPMIEPILQEQLAAVEVLWHRLLEGACRVF